MLFVDINSKYKMDNTRTFKQQFVDDEHGAQAFADELVQQFQPDERIDSFRASCTRSQARGKRRKILVGPTGQNRHTLLQRASAARAMETWMEKVKSLLQDRMDMPVDLLLFVPTESDEATFELIATEWLVQRGDLDVIAIPSSGARVPFGQLELSQALTRANKTRGSGGPASGFTLQEFIWEFSDLVDQDLDEDFLRKKFRQAVNMRKFQQAARGAHQLDSAVVDAAALSETFRKSPQLMRALVKSRLFNGTLSAGGGSCQITVKPDRSDEQRRRSVSISTRSSDPFSVKLGNKTPMNGDTPLFPKDAPMSEKLIEAWRCRIQDELLSMDLPAKLNKGLRGVYIGISAVYYAAESAKCHERLLPKAEFLARLDERVRKLLEDQPLPSDQGGRQVYDHREFSNLVLVHEIISSVLADSAWIVCKRKWRAQPAGLEVAALPGNAEPAPKSADPAAGSGSPSPLPEVQAFPLKLPEYVATWSLGLFLSRLEGQ